MAVAVVTARGRRLDMRNVPARGIGPGKAFVRALGRFRFDWKQSKRAESAQDIAS